MRLALYAFSLCLLGLVLGANVPDIGFDDMPLRAGLSNNIIGRTTSADIDTFTWVFATSWQATPGSSNYPDAADIDSLIQDSDGSLFKYGELRQSYPLTASISTSRLRVEDYRQPDNMPYASMRAGYIYWPFHLIPAGSQIIRATMYGYAVGVITSPLNEISSILAVIDTSSYNFARVDAHDSGATNVETSWRFTALASEDTTSNTSAGRWTSDLSSHTDISLWGLSETAIAPGEAVDAETYWSLDITSVVQKMSDDQLDDRLIWLLYEAGLSAAGTDWHISCGSGAGATNQPFVVVDWASERKYEPGRFVVCSDNHSNPRAVGRMKDALDGALGDFMVHVGDANLGTNMDTTGCDTCFADAVADTFGSDYPLFMLWGNHEEAVDGAGAMSGFVIGHNRAAIPMIDDFGGNLVRLGTKWDSNEDRFKAFSFDYGPVHIIGFNPIGTIAGSDLDADLMKWIANDLTLTKQPIKIAMAHYPIWEAHDIDTGSSSNYGGIANAQEAWEFLDDLGVHAYISGHLHRANIDKFGSMYLIQNPAMKWDTRQGFTCFDTNANGSVTVTCYRADTGGDGNPYNETRSFTLSPTRTAAAARDDGVWATGGGRFEDGSTVEILGQGFGASIGTVIITDAATIAGSTLIDAQTVADWEDGWIQITCVVANNPSEGSGYLHVIANGGSPAYEGWAITLDAAGE